MRLRSLLFTACLLLPTLVAHADSIDPNPSDFTTTITGGGNTLVFPNFGGPLYAILNRISTIQIGGLPVTVNGVSPTTTAGYPALAELVFVVSPSTTSYNDLDVMVNGSIHFFQLYGLNLVGFANGLGFYVFPGTYNLTDVNGVPYTYIVTNNTQAAATPEPTTLTLLATGLLGAAIRLRKRNTV